MMRSLFSGVAGLKTHQTKMDVIGHNISNVNTVSYKSQAVTFNTLLYQTTQAASGANQQTGLGGKNARQIGLGVKMGAISTLIDNPGSAQTTNNPFDIMITGDSFFIVNNGTSNYFTRDGSFYVDGAGNLCMSSTGYNVMGWQVDEKDPTSIRADRVSALKIMQAENMVYDAEATTEGYVSGIVDANDSNINSTAGKVVSLLIYDDVGYQYTARFSFHGTADKSEYYMTLEDVLDQNGKSISEASGKDIHELVGWGSNDLPPVFTDDTVSLSSKVSTFTKGDTEIKMRDAKSEFGPYVIADIFKDGTAGIEPIRVDPADNTSEITGYTVTAQAITDAKKAYTDSTADPKEPKGLYSMLLNAYGMTEEEIDGINRMEFDLEKGEITITEKNVKNSVIVKYDPKTGIFKDVTGGNSSGDVSQLTFDTSAKGLEAFADSINVDFTTSRQANNNKAATVSATNGDLKGNNAGRKIGDMSGVTIQQDGKIYATYDNGCSRLLGQIAVAHFANASGLSLEADNLYAETQNSGEFDGVGDDISADGGYMTTGELEMSNVDLSSEFTEMITTQRGFQANSRIITVSDTMLEELTNLKR